MATVQALEINGTVYDIEDEVAREGLDDITPKAEDAYNIATDILIGNQNLYNLFKRGFLLKKIYESPYIPLDAKGSRWTQSLGDLKEGVYVWDIGSLSIENEGVNGEFLQGRCNLSFTGASARATGNLGANFLIEEHFDWEDEQETFYITPGSCVFSVLAAAPFTVTVFAYGNEETTTGQCKFILHRIEY